MNKEHRDTEMVMKREKQTGVILSQAKKIRIHHKLKEVSPEVFRWNVALLKT
jgi:hypothetical protein